MRGSARAEGRRAPHAAARPPVVVIGYMLYRRKTSNGINPATGQLTTTTTVAHKDKPVTPA